MINAHTTHSENSLGEAEGSVESVPRRAHSRVQEPVPHGTVVSDLVLHMHAHNVLERVACGSRRSSWLQRHSCSALSAG